MKSADSTQAASSLATVLPLFPPEVLPPPRLGNTAAREHRRARPSRYAPHPQPPCAPLPARVDCYRHPTYAVPSSPVWQSAQQFCDLYLAETDAARKQHYHDMMIAALLALDHTQRQRR